MKLAAIKNCKLVLYSDFSIEKLNSKAIFSATGTKIFDSAFPDKLSSTSPQFCRSIGLGCETCLIPSVVCCFQFIYIFPWPFKIVYGPCLSYIKWYHDHNVFYKVPLLKFHYNIIWQHIEFHMSSTLSSIPGNVCCLTYYSSYFPYFLNLIYS